MSFPELLQIIALIVFVIAAIGLSFMKTDLIAIGLALWVLSTFITELGHLSLSIICLLYTSPSPRDLSTSRMPSSA